MNKKLINLLLGLIDGLDHDVENNQIKDIIKLQNNNKNKILEDVANITLKYNIVDNMLDIPNKERKGLKKKVSSLIDKTTALEYKKESAIVEGLLKTNAVERHKINNYFYGKVFKISYDLKQLPSQELRKIVDTKVKGELWSDRLWRHKKSLNKKLRKDVYNILDGKTNINTVSEEIAKKYKQSFSKSRTLVRTETTRVQYEANEDWCRQNGIEEQLFVATLDESTSDICQELDGNTYSIDDSSKPEIPDDTHINCRSCYVNIPFKDWKPSIRIDNITKQNINYKTYKEWSKGQ